MSILDFPTVPIDQRQLRDAFGRFATGVTVITTRTPSGVAAGLTANSFSAVSLDPPLLMWSLRQSSALLPAFLQSAVFAVNVLALEQAALARRFAMPGRNKFDGIRYDWGFTGCPLIAGCLAHFECRTENSFGCGDHQIFIGYIERSAHRDGEPLIFSTGAYCALSALPISSSGDAEP
ncbi:MAG TPA: flavin reductase family protein [Hyphomicrobiaceae bacterium]|nr:flavin reductase family protein [Hyphomicrobiaceae bacterium]